MPKYRSIALMMGTSSVINITLNLLIGLGVQASPSALREIAFMAGVTGFLLGGIGCVVYYTFCDPHQPPPIFEPPESERSSLNVETPPSPTYYTYVQTHFSGCDYPQSRSLSPEKPVSSPSLKRSHTI